MSQKGKTNIARLTQWQSSCFVSRQSQVRILHLARGCSSFGRAPHLHCGGSRFDSCQLHNERDVVQSSNVYLAISNILSRSYINKQWRLYVICSFINICRCAILSLPRCKRVNQKGMARSSSGQDSWFSSTQQGFDYPTGY